MLLLRQYKSVYSVVQQFPAENKNCLFTDVSVLLTLSVVALEEESSCA